MAVLFTICASSARAQRAADDYYDPREMAEARNALKASHGDQINSLLIGERLEYLSNESDPLILWEAQGWVGKDLRKLWVKTEGEFNLDDSEFEEAEVQVLYSRAISPFWDLQAGIRHDLEPGPSRSYAAVGVQGLAPYWFEVDAAIFLSDMGRLSGRLELEYEIRLTQRLIVQPRIELNAAFSNDRAIDVGAGLSTSDFGLRIRYEFICQFAPYVGLSYSRSYGDTKRFRRSDAGATDQLSFVAGVRLWY